MGRLMKFIQKAAAAILCSACVLSPAVSIAVQANTPDEMPAIEVYAVNEDEMNEEAGSTDVLKEASPAVKSSALDSFKARYAAGERQSLGFIGFLIGLGDDQAASILADGISRGLLGESAAGSPSSIDCVLRAVDVIEQGNAIRTSMGRTPLMADPELMAISMVQTAASRGVMEHSRLYDVNENLAWGSNPSMPFGSGGNPFDAWYTQEAAMLAANPNAFVPHYNNILRADFTRSGAAYCELAGSIAGRATGQVFAGGTGSMIYSTEELRTALNVYRQDGTSLRPEQIFVNDSAINGKRMYRLYNPNSGEHFYTSNAAERNSLINAGWKYEGTGWIAPEKSQTPVYRLYNPVAGDHHYTVDADERDGLIEIGWKDEGIGWYSAQQSEAPIYRQYNPNASTGAHNFTSSEEEHNALGASGWKLEGIAWYAVSSDAS